MLSVGGAGIDNLLNAQPLGVSPFQRIVISLVAA
jgi:hypothetical protein